MTKTVKAKSDTWNVVHGTEVQSEPVSVEDCYYDRDPYGEYVLFAASNVEAIRDDKISIVSYRYLAEARVTFEHDLVEQGANDIEWCREDFAEQGEAFVTEIWPSWQDVTLADVADAIFPEGQDFVMARTVLSVSDQSASWVEITRVEAHLPAEMALTCCVVENDRLLEIKVVLKDADVLVSHVAEQWSALVERFRSLPYAKLSGAKRVEPIVDEDGFDVDTIGEVAGEA